MIGCQKVSPGCAHCYAEALAPRLGVDFNEITLKPNRLDQPLRWRRPRRIFVNSLSDLFLDGIPDSFIDQVFAVMALATQHTFQLLTKRPDRMLAYLSGGGPGVITTWGGGKPTTFERIRAAAESLIGLHQLKDRKVTWPLPNVWLGVSVENQTWADNRIPKLLATPAAVRWISAEPLLGPVNLSGYFGHERELSQTSSAWIPGLDWVVVGGESGPKARPMNPDWARMIRNECRIAGVPFLFKQWGEWGPDGHKEPGTYALTEHPGDSKTLPSVIFPGGQIMRKQGKRKTGRHLDGILWDGYPAVKP